MSKLLLFTSQLEPKRQIAIPCSDVLAIEQGGKNVLIFMKDGGHYDCFNTDIDNLVERFNALVEP